MVQSFAFLRMGQFLAKIKTVKIAASATSIVPRLPVLTGATKIKTAKISSGALICDSTKFAPTKINFPLYCIRMSICMYVYLYANIDAIVHVFIPAQVQRYNYTIIIRCVISEWQCSLCSH